MTVRAHELKRNTFCRVGMHGQKRRLTSRTAAMKDSVFVLYCTVENVMAPKVKKSNSTPIAKYTPSKDARYSIAT